MSHPPQTLSAFGGSFLSAPPDRTFTPEDFDREERMMIAAASEFSRGEVLPVVDRLDHQEEGLMRALITRAGELGFCGPDTPDAYGGLGLGKNVAARMLEFLSLNGSFSVTAGITSGISQVGLTLFGDEDQKNRYLPRLASGEWIGAYALSEPNSGSDALSLLTRAERVGDGFRLTGTKMWISNAKWADLFLVMAKIDGEHLAAFLVERGYPGVEISREEHKMGLKGSSTARLVLENAEVPAQNLLYEPGKGHHVAFNALNIGRFKLASMSMGPARASFEAAATYALERRQFGRPIAEFGLIRQKFAEMAACFFAAEAMVYRTGALIDAAFAAQPDTIDGRRAAAEEFAIECSACKVFATEVEAFLVDESLQVFGGYGFTEEFPVARNYRDARVSRIYEGTNEINRVFMSDRLLRRAAEGRVSLAGACDSFVAELAAKAFQSRPTDQIRLGALSDLLMLTYAEQSARLRARRLGELGQALHACFENAVAVEAAAAFRQATGESVTLPAPRLVDMEALGAQLIAGQGIPEF